jgi:hypothetical protein
VKFSSTVKKNGSFANVNKQIRFATALALTKTAKDGQTAVIGALQSNFTLRTQWYQPANKMGVRIKTAKKNDLEAQVKTASGFLKKFESGEDKLPRRKRIAIPTENVRRNKRDIITKANRPNNLRQKRTFLLETSKGLVLFQRKFKGKRSKIVPLYLLRARARTPKKPSFYAPARKTARENFGKNFADACKQAFATARK